MFPSSCLIYMLPYLLSEVEDRGSVRLWGAPPTQVCCLNLSCRAGTHMVSRSGLCTYLQFHSYFHAHAHACMPMRGVRFVCMQCATRVVSLSVVHLTPGESWLFRGLGE